MKTPEPPTATSMPAATAPVPRLNLASAMTPVASAAVPRLNLASAAAQAPPLQAPDLHPVPSATNPQPSAAASVPRLNLASAVTPQPPATTSVPSLNLASAVTPPAPAAAPATAPPASVPKLNLTPLIQQRQEEQADHLPYTVQVRGGGQGGRGEKREHAWVCRQEWWQAFDCGSGGVKRTEGGACSLVTWGR